MCIYMYIEYIFVGFDKYLNHQLRRGRVEVKITTSGPPVEFHVRRRGNQNRREEKMHEKLDQWNVSTVVLDVFPAGVLGNVTITMDYGDFLEGRWLCCW